MNPEQKLAEIVISLRGAGIDSLVMGGHAARYYGIDRNTIDYDLVTSLTSPEDLRQRLPAIDNFREARPAPAWRHRDFARFEIGRLPDGREEYLEFWLRNHLLGDFVQLKQRSEIGVYGGHSIPFLSIADLIRSKETERESDWQDIALLEEIFDARKFAAFRDGRCDLPDLLANIRSRVGMERAIDQGLLADPNLVASAIADSQHPATIAFLWPSARQIDARTEAAYLDPSLSATLRAVEAGSSKHFAIVEIARRGYKRHAMDIDRADKQTQIES